MIPLRTHASLRTHTITRTVLAVFAITISLIALPACSKRDAGVVPGGAPAGPGGVAGAVTPPSIEYKTTQVANGATLSGTIRFTGAVPPRPPITVDSDKEFCGNHEILPEELIVSASGGVRNAVVWLEGVKEGKDWSATEVSQDQNGCVFSPHVVVVGVNRPLTFVNSDPVVHNVRTFPRENLPLNLSLLAKGAGKPTSKSFLFPDEMKAACDSHKWMGAWIIVRDNPYFAVTGDDGAYSIDGIPPGKYNVVFWHEALERVDKEITVTAGETVAEDLEMKGR